MNDHVVTRYELSELDQKMLERWRHYHPRDDQSRRYIKINQSTRRLCQILLENCPRSRELATAITHLENVRLWANNSIMKNERPTDDDISDPK